MYYGLNKFLCWRNMLKNLGSVGQDFFYRSLFEYTEIVTELTLKVLVSNRQCKLHNKPLLGSLLCFMKILHFARALFSIARYNDLFFSFFFIMQKKKKGSDQICGLVRLHQCKIFFFRPTFKMTANIPGIVFSILDYVHQNLLTS